MSNLLNEGVDADLVALKAALRALLDSIVEHYEDDIGFRSEFVRKAIVVVNDLEIHTTPAGAEEIRARARLVLQNLFR